jgi:hypothetical protein
MKRQPSITHVLIVEISGMLTKLTMMNFVLLFFVHETKNKATIDENHYTFFALFIFAL